MLQVVSACMNSSVKCLGDLNLTGSQACGKVCCEVNWTQGLKPSHHSPDSGLIIGTSSGAASV